MKKHIALAATLGLAITFTLNACEEKEKKQDGTTYRTVKIGEQVWMAENLSIDLPGSKCYDNKPENCQKYGRLYNWETAKKACPSGWHLPSEAEWKVMTASVGGDDTAGKVLKSKSDWNENGNGTDAYGFSALPSGKCNLEGNFDEIGDRGNWWSSSDHNNNSDDNTCLEPGFAYYKSIYVYENASDNCSVKSDLFSVRCIQGDAKATASESLPSGEEGCPDSKEPPITTEAVFLRNSENAEGIGFSTFRLPDGEKAMDFNEHNLEEGDKVTITYKSSGRYDGEERCYYFKEVLSVKKIGK